MPVRRHIAPDHATVQVSCPRKIARRNDGSTKVCAIDSLGLDRGPVSHAQIKHIEMRVEGMT